jgi:hypothetical protein
MPQIKLTVRDGRAGRDPAQVTPDGGEILAAFEHNSTFDEGDRLILPDGSPVMVIGSTERIYRDRVEQTVHIGNVPEN